MAVDPIGAAIAAAEAPTPIALREFRVTISSSGRPAAVLLPVDATDAELAEFAGWLLTQVMGVLRTERRRTAGGRLIIPRA